MTRSGKSEAASRWAADKARVVVWDPQLDWKRFGFATFERLAELARAWASSAHAPARCTFHAPIRQPAVFGDFCRLALAWAKLKPATIVVEELSWCSSPGKAPPGWHELVTGGLKYGLNIVSITQRPQESDKTALSQADLVRCFMLERAADQKYMAAELGVELERIRGLEPLEFIEKNRRTRKVTAGRITF